MKKKNINEIIEYFEKYSNFLDAEYSKGEQQIREKNNQIRNYLPVLFSFIMIGLTIISFVFGSVNSVNSSLQSIDSLCNEKYFSLINNSNFIKDCYNLTTQKLKVHTNLIDSTKDIFEALKLMFLIITIFILGYLLYIYFTEKDSDKQLVILNEKILLIKSIILNLYSLKINNSEKINSKDVQNVLDLFDKSSVSIDTKEHLMMFDKKLTYLLNRFLKEKNEKFT